MRPTLRVLDGIVKMPARIRLARSSFARDKRGNITIIFSLSLLAMVAAVGAAVDFGRMHYEKTRLDEFADSATLMAVNEVNGAITTAAAKTQGSTAFSEMAQTQGTVSVNNLNLDVSDSGGTRTAVLQYSASIPATFTGIFNGGTLNFAGGATSVSGTPSYTDVFVLVDNTVSMGLAATTADIQHMQAITPDQCAFACHELDKPGKDYYSLAKNNGVTLRIDSVRSAVQQVINVAQQQAATTPNQYRFSVYTFGNSITAQALTPMFTQSTDLAGAIAAANAIDIMTIAYPNNFGDAGTNFATMFNGVNGVVPAQGDGTSWQSTKKIVFFISDGVNDSPASACNQLLTSSTDPMTHVSHQRCQEPLDPVNCATLKNRNVTLATLYTTYLPITNNNWYNSYVGPYNPGPYSPSLNSQIAAGMQDCATSGYYQEVGPDDSLSGAISDLFLKAISMPRVTN